MSHVRTKIEILNKSLVKVAEVKVLYPINDKGMILRYSKELSDYGTCTFRVDTRDPFFDQYGDILQPHVYNVRINRGGTIVWAGAIVDNPVRNRDYIEVKACEYEFYLSKVLIRRDSEVTAGDGKNNYRTFKSGTMAAAVTDLITKAVTDFGAIHPMAGLTLGTVETPDYPAGFVNGSGVALTGAWSFTDFITLQFDYHSVKYVLDAFGVYTGADYEVTSGLVFNFKKFIGNKQNGITFEYGTRGNIVDYNTPRLGNRMVNDLWGIAADINGNVLNSNQRDEDSVKLYGLLQDAEAYADVKDKNFLKTRMNEGLQFTKTPEDAPVNVILDEKAYPLGQYGIGDIVTVKIKDHVIDYNKPRRIVGITVSLHNTGRELTSVQTNQPRARDVGA